MKKSDFNTATNYIKSAENIITTYLKSQDS